MGAEGEGRGGSGGTAGHPIRAVGRPSTSGLSVRPASSSPRAKAARPSTSGAARVRRGESTWSARSAGAWGLALLAVATAAALASLVSAWLVPPYLAAMAWLLLGPQGAGSVDLAED